eukprot:scaffold34686_cov160-Amphora_coffeaeformis.AAC.2
MMQWNGHEFGCYCSILYRKVAQRYSSFRTPTRADSVDELLCSASSIELDCMHPSQLKHFKLLWEGRW